MTVTEFFTKLDAGATWSAGVSFKRANPLPLDKYSVFASKALADDYAANNAVAYPGQIIAVASETEDAVYYIGHDMALHEVGPAILVDGVSIAKDDDNTLSLVGFAEAEEGAQPRKNANGEIEWVVPSTDTVDGLQTTVAGLQSDLTALDERVGAIEESIGDVTEGKTVVEMIADAQTAATYDDTALANRVQAIEDDYLTSADKYDDTALAGRVAVIESDYLKAADKVELQGDIKTNADDIAANAAAIEELGGEVDANAQAIAAIKEDVDAFFADADLTESAKDTLKELQEYIASDETAASEMLASIKQNADAIDAVEGRMDTAEGKIEALEAIEHHSHDNKAVLDGITEAKVSAWDAAEGNAKTHADGLNTAMDARVQVVEGKAHEHSNKDVLDGITAEQVAAWEEAEKNVIASVDEEQFAVDSDRKLTLLDIAMDKVVGLPAALAAKADAATTLAGYGITDAYTQSEVNTKIEEALATATGGESAADVLVALNNYKESNDAAVAAVVTDIETLETKMDTIEEGAQVNVIAGVSEEFAVSDEKVLSVNAIEMEKITGLPDALASKLSGVTVGGVKVEPDENGVVALPGALQETLGMVKGTDAENGVSINDDHTMTINSVNINKLVQTEGEYLVLDGGGASA